MTNRGKQFEGVIKDAFLEIDDVSIDRIHDQTTRYKGSTNICDFIVYKYPFEYYIECKSVHGNTLSIHSNDKKHWYGNITNQQFEGMLEKTSVKGVFAGVICWWVDRDTTKFIPIEVIKNFSDLGIKSIRWDDPDPRMISIEGKKKRVFYKYDARKFFNEVERRAYYKEGDNK